MHCNSTCLGLTNSGHPFFEFEHWTCIKKKIYLLVQRFGWLARHELEHISLSLNIFEVNFFRVYVEPFVCAFKKVSLLNSLAFICLHSPWVPAAEMVSFQRCAVMNNFYWTKNLLLHDLLEMFKQWDKSKRNYHASDCMLPRMRKYIQRTRFLKLRYWQTKKLRKRKILILDMFEEKFSSMYLYFIPRTDAIHFRSQTKTF